MTHCGMKPVELLGHKGTILRVSRPHLRGSRPHSRITHQERVMSLTPGVGPRILFNTVSSHF